MSPRAQLLQRFEVLAVTAARPDSAIGCRLCTVLVMVAVSGSTPVAPSASIKVMVLPLEVAFSSLVAWSAVVKSVTKVLSVALLATRFTLTPPTATV